MMNVQNNSNCAADPNTRSTTTARIGDIASLPLEYFLDNMTWPDPYTLTAVRVGIDYSTNPNAGIYLSNATSPFASIVTGSYVANSTSVTNANAGRNVADTAITFSYDTYADEASRAAGLGSAPSLVGRAGEGPVPTYLPAIAYPYATSSATTTLNTLSSATTTSYTEYTPFGGYTLDTRGFTTTDISINGNVVATYTYTPASSSSPATSSLSYIHTNYLGTPVLSTNDKGDTIYISLTDVNGNIILRDVRNDSTLLNKVYTGHKYDNVTGLTYAHARYLDTRMHTFTSVDPMYYTMPSAYMYDPQQMNSYGYAGNNPVANTDPNGQWFLAVIVGIVAVANYFIQSTGVAKAPANQQQLGPSRIDAKLAHVQQASNYLTISVTFGAGAISLASKLNTGSTLSTMSGKVSGNSVIGGSQGTAVSATTGSTGASVASIDSKAAVMTGRAEQAEAGFPMVKPGSNNAVTTNRYISKKVRKQSYEESQGVCVFCGNKTTSESGPLKTNAEHSISVKNGGDNTISNIQNSCQTCNLDKGSMNSNEYIEKIYSGIKKFILDD